MGTRSNIIVQHPKTGTYASVYCHWDGYVEHHGPILLNNYSSLEQAVALVSLGGISQLNKTLEDTVSYYKWRRDPIEICVSPDINDHTTEGYHYLFANGDWYVEQYQPRGWRKLKDVMENPETWPKLPVIEFPAGRKGFENTVKKLKGWTK
jgi:hypothetical protein